MFRGLAEILAGVRAKVQYLIYNTFFALIKHFTGMRKSLKQMIIHSLMTKGHRKWSQQSKTTADLLVFLVYKSEVYLADFPEIR